MTASKAQLKATNKYKKKTYDRIEIFVRKELGIKEKIEEHCIKYGYLNEQSNKKTNRAAFIIKAIETQMAVDSGEYELVKK